MDIKKGDRVIITNGDEERAFEGRVFNVLSEPYMCGVEVVEIECPEIKKHFWDGYPTKFLKKV